MKLRKRYGRALGYARGRDLWTVDYRGTWPDGKGLWFVGVVRALTAADAVAALAKVEGRRGVTLSRVRVTPGNDVPRFEKKRILDARSILR
jgi:hypothetical protein